MIDAKFLQVDNDSKPVGQKAYVLTSFAFFSGSQGTISTANRQRQGGSCASCILAFAKSGRLVFSILFSVSIRALTELGTYPLSD